MRWVWPLLVLLLLTGVAAGAWLAFPQLVAWYLKDRATAEGIPLTLEGVAVSWDSRELTLDGVALGAANRPLRLRRVVLGFDADAPLWGLPLLERVHVTGGEFPVPLEGKAAFPGGIELARWRAFLAAVPIPDAIAVEDARILPDAPYGPVEVEAFELEGLGRDDRPWRVNGRLGLAGGGVAVRGSLWPLGRRAWLTLNLQGEGLTLEALPWPDARPPLEARGSASLRGDLDLRRAEAGWALEWRGRLGLGDARIVPGADQVVLGDLQWRGRVERTPAREWALRGSLSAPYVVASGSGERPWRLVAGGLDWDGRWRVAPGDPVAGRGEGDLRMEQGELNRGDAPAVTWRRLQAWGMDWGAAGRLGAGRLRAVDLAGAGWSVGTLELEQPRLGAEPGAAGARARQVWLDTRPRGALQAREVVLEGLAGGALHVYGKGLEFSTGEDGPLAAGLEGLALLDLSLAEDGWVEAVRARVDGLRMEVKGPLEGLQPPWPRALPWPGLRAALAQVADGSRLGYRHPGLTPPLALEVSPLKARMRRLQWAPEGLSAEFEARGVVDDEAPLRAHGTWSPQPDERRVQVVVDNLAGARVAGAAPGGIADGLAGARLDMAWALEGAAWRLAVDTAGFSAGELPSGSLLGRALRLLADRAGRMNLELTGPREDGLAGALEAAAVAALRRAYGPLGAEPGAASLRRGEPVVVTPGGRHRGDWVAALADRLARVPRLHAALCPAGQGDLNGDLRVRGVAEERLHPCPEGWTGPRPAARLTVP